MKDYYELIDAIAENPLVFYALMGLMILLFVLCCMLVKGPTYGYL